jgi:hypothetical protein
LQSEVAQRKDALHPRLAVPHLVRCNWIERWLAAVPESGTQSLGARVLRAATNLVGLRIDVPNNIYERTLAG